MQLGFLFKKRQLRSRLQNFLNPNFNTNLNFAAVPNLLAAPQSYPGLNIPSGVTTKNIVNTEETGEKKKKNFSNKKAKLLILFFLLTAFVVGGYRLIKHKSKTTPVVSQTQISASKKIISINKKFTFPGMDNQGKKAGEIVLTITSAEKNPEVIVKDQTFKAKEGKLFLIINLELQNDSTNRLNIFPGDLIRLVAGQEDKKFAPDLHNNVVLVAPISTKIDRVGFVIDADAKNLKLLVGELEKKKTEVLLKF